MLPIQHLIVQHLRDCEIPFGHKTGLLPSPDSEVETLSVRHCQAVNRFKIVEYLYQLIDNVRLERRFFRPAPHGFGHTEQVLRPNVAEIFRFKVQGHLHTPALFGAHAAGASGHLVLGYADGRPGFKLPSGGLVANPQDIVC